MISGVCCKILSFLCVLSCMVFFSIFFWHYFVLKCLKKIIRTFFFWSKVHKSKHVYLYYFYKILKFYKDWITEFQKMCKIAIRKFAIFSSGLIFMEKFLNSLVPFFLVSPKIIRCSVENWGAIEKQISIKIFFLQFCEFSVILSFNIYKI